MDALLHNPIADMYGTDFLLLYGSIIMLTVLVCGWLIQDPTKNQPLPLIPHEPDPYKIAYLRSGALEVTKVAIFNLILRDYLQINEKLISQTSNYDDLSELQPIEREAFSSYSSSPSVKSVELIAQKVQLYCNIYEEQLHNDQLLSTQKWQEWKITVGLIGATIILSLGSYKLLVALGKGRYNAGFLIAMGVLSIIFILWFVSRRSRLSHRGEAYLQQLQETFAQLQSKVKFSISSVFDYNLVVALFGVEALAGTAYDSYYKVFLPPQPTSTSSSQSSSTGSYRGSGSSCNGCSSCSSGGGFFSSGSSDSSGSSCSSSGCGGGHSDSSGSSCSGGSSCGGGSSCSSGSSCGGGGCGGCGGG